MKDWILSNKKAVATVSILSVLIIAIIIFIQNKNSMETIQEGDALDFVHETAGIEAWGEVLYSRIESISIDFPARVTDVQVEEGERIILNQPLVTLDISQYEGNVEKLKQQLAANQSALASAAQDISALQADILQTQNDIARKGEEYKSGTSADIVLLENSLNIARKELEDAERDFESYQSLYNEGAVSETTFNQYASMLDQRRKVVDDVETNIEKTKTALKDELDLLKVSLKSKETQLSQVQQGNDANVAMYQSSLISTQVDLDNMISKLEKDYIKENQIVSNIKNGIVKNIAVTKGNYLGTQGMPTEVLQIVDADSITVSADVYEEFIGNVEIGGSVRIVPTPSPDISLKGTVTHIPELAVENDGRRIVRVTITPDDPTDVLKPGFTADLYFEETIR